MKYSSKENRKNEEAIEKQCKNQKQPLPQWLVERRRNKPELAFGLNFYYEAFFNIGTDRMPSQGVWNISWSSIQRYADHFEMDFEQSEKLHFLIARMDDSYIEFMSEKNGKEEQQSKRSGKPTKKGIKKDNN